MQFVQLVVTETFAKSATLLGTGMGSYIVKGCIMGKENWKPPFKESEEIVWFLYYLMANFFTTIIFPYSILY